MERRKFLRNKVRELGHDFIVLCWFLCLVGWRIILLPMTLSTVVRMYLIDKEELEAKIESIIKEAKLKIEGNEGLTDMEVDGYYFLINWHTHRGMGYCRTYWAIKKEILKSDYGIHWWETPEERWFPFLIVKCD